MTAADMWIAESEIERTGGGHPMTRSPAPAESTPIDHASCEAFALDVVDRFSHPQVRALAEAYLDTREKLRGALARIDEAIRVVDEEERHG